MRGFLDANVLFSAAHSPSGRARGLFSLAEKGPCELVASGHAIGEARRNIATKEPENLRSFEDVMRLVSVGAEGGPNLVAWGVERGLPENDAPILAAAVAAGVDLLVTGDRRHFGRLFERTVGDVRVVTLREALKELSGP